MFIEGNKSVRAPVVESTIIDLTKLPSSVQAITVTFPNLLVPFRHRDYLQPRCPVDLVFL